MRGRVDAGRVSDVSEEGIIKGEITGFCKRERKTPSFFVVGFDYLGHKLKTEKLRCQKHRQKQEQNTGAQLKNLPIVW